MNRKTSEKDMRNLGRLAELAKEGTPILVKHISDLEDEVIKVDAKASQAIEIASKTQKMEGRSGPKGDKGDQGERGEKGEPGKNGLDGKPGKDGHEGRDGRDGRDGLDGLPGEKGKDGDIKNISPQELRDLLELLQGDERIDAKAIKGLKEYLKLNPPNGPMLHTPALANLPDVSVVGVITGQVLTWNGTYWYASTPSSSGSGFQLPLTGSVNGSNRTFTWATAPNAICVDGQTLAATTQDSSATVNWTGTTTTVLTVAPNYSCFAVA
jgi:hypothetical protein